METLATFISAMTTAMAVLSAFWIYRKTGQVDSVHSAFALGIIMYTLYHFFSCSTGAFLPLHGIITGLFISACAVVNACCSTYMNNPDIKIGVDRRKTATPIYENTLDDRRVTNPHLIFKEVNKV